MPNLPTLPINIEVDRNKQQQLAKTTSALYHEKAKVFSLISSVLGIMLLLTALIFSIEFLKVTGGVLISLATSIFAASFYRTKFTERVEKEKTQLLLSELKGELYPFLREMEENIGGTIKQIKGEILSEKTKIEDDYSAEIYKQFGNYLPAKIFSAGDKPDAAYNKEVTEAFRKSKNYGFKGVLGEFISVRLEQMANEKNLASVTVKVLLFDPRTHSIGNENKEIPDALKEYAKNKFTEDDLSPEQKLVKIRRNIYRSIIGLFDTKEKVSIQLGLYKDVIFYRAEIFDEAMFISFYDKGIKKFGSFPTGYSYEKNSIYYDSFNYDFNQTWRLKTVTKEFISTTPDSVLEDLLIEIGCKENIADLRREFNERKASLLSQLDEALV